MVSIEIATELRRCWMRLMGCEDDEIEESIVFDPPNLEREVEELQALIEIQKRNKEKG